MATNINETNYTGNITKEDFINYFHAHYDDFLYKTVIYSESAAITDCVIEYIDTRPLDELGNLQDDDDAIINFYDELSSKYFNSLYEICEKEILPYIY